MFQVGIIHDLRQDYSYSLTGFLFPPGGSSLSPSCGAFARKSPRRVTRRGLIHHLMLLFWIFIGQAHFRNRNHRSSRRVSL